MSYDHICLGLFFAARAYPFLEQCSVTVAAWFKKHRPSAGVTSSSISSLSLYIKCTVNFPATMAAMKTGVKVQAIDELGRYPDGKIVKVMDQDVAVQSQSSVPSTIRSFPCHLAASVYGSPRALSPSKSEAGKLFLFIYAVIYVLIYSYTVFTVVYSSLSPFVFWSRDHKSHDLFMLFLCHVDHKKAKFSPLIMHFVDWYWYWTSIIPISLVMIR